MTVVKADVQARHDDLVKQRDQMVANLNLLSGMVSDCEFWLAEFDVPEPAEQTASPKAE